MLTPISKIQTGDIFRWAADNFIVRGDTGTKKVAMNTSSQELKYFGYDIEVMRTGVSMRAEFYKENLINEIPG